MNAGHCNGVKEKKNCPFECINIHLCSYMHIFHMIFFFFQHLFIYFMFFSSSIFREKKTLNENKCESHFGPVYLLCISVCVKLRTMMKNNNKRMNKNSWWNFVRFSSYLKKPTMTHLFTVSFTCVRFFIQIENNLYENVINILRLRPRESKIQSILVINLENTTRWQIKMMNDKYRVQSVVEYFRAYRQSSMVFFFVLLGRKFDGIQQMFIVIFLWVKSRIVRNKAQ